MNKVKNRKYSSEKKTDRNDSSRKYPSEKEIDHNDSI